MSPLILIPEAGGERLDAFLARSIEGLTRSAAQRLLEEGAATSKGHPLKKSDKTVPGQAIEVVLPEPVPVDILPQDIPLDVVYEDRDVIVVNKPVGMVVHPAPGHPDGTLVNALLYHCGSSLSGINGALRPGIVHRIDRDTSGLIIAAKNDTAHLALAAQLQDHSLARVYEAVAVGGFREDSGNGGCPHRPSSGGPEKNGHRADSRPPRSHPLAGSDPLFRLYPRGVPPGETGRTHQIRVHLSSIGHPLLGDTVYGSKKTLPRSGRPVPARTPADLPPSPQRGADPTGVSPPGLVPSVLDRLSRRG